MEWKKASDGAVPLCGAKWTADGTSSTSALQTRQMADKKWSSTRRNEGGRWRSKVLFRRSLTVVTRRWKLSQSVADDQAVVRSVGDGEIVILDIVVSTLDRQI